MWAKAKNKANDLSDDNRELEQTIRQCQQGNPLAWEALVKQFQAKVYGVAYYYLRNSADAQDATQDVFIKVFNSLDKLERSQETFPAWLVTIARNSCLDRIRKSRTRQRYEDEYEKSDANVGLTRDTPETRNVEEQRRRLMYAALAEFDDTNRDIVLLKEIQGLKLEEVAEIMSLPVGTIKSRSNRVRIALAKRLIELVGDHPDAKEAL